MHPYGLTLVTAPTTEPVELNEAKQWCKLEADSTDDDDVVRAVIAGARKYIENRTEKALFTQTWRLTLDCFPAVIYVPRPPLASVSSIVYVATGGTSTTMDAADYRVDTNCQPGRITPAYGEVWPTTRGVIAAVTVTFVAGKAVASIDPDMKLALRVLIEHYYSNRGVIITGTISSEVALSVDAILGLHEVGSYA